MIVKPLRESGLITLSLLMGPASARPKRERPPFLIWLTAHIAVEKKTSTPTHSHAVCYSCRQPFLRLRPNRYFYTFVNFTRTVQDPVHSQPTRH